ncbi:MAG: adenosylcobinamide amidohydrolase, partial [Thermodesulfobacteriota bacterium]
AFESPPRQLVSLVPSITEILFRIGAGDAVAGVTVHDTFPAEAASTPVVGGFFNPSLKRIRAIHPDLIFIADLHRAVADAYAESPTPRLVQLPLNCLEDLYRAVRFLGRVFDRETDAQALVQSIGARLTHTRRKTAGVPESRRKRVLRLMGRDRVMTPGDDSFQNELIRLAGGIPPVLGKPGKVVSVTLEEWQDFNPEVIYGCGGDRAVEETLLNRPGWRDVDAVRNGRIFYFPCDLTCRLSTRTGDFVSCLAARIYEDEWADLPPVLADAVTGRRPISLNLDGVASAEVVESRLFDYPHQTLLVHLSAPMAVVSTLEGFRTGIRHVGNGSSPPQVWGIYGRIGLEESRRRLLEVLDRHHRDTSLLFTGAEMDHLSVQHRRYRGMTVCALVTAGVKSNAIRTAEDIGAYYEPGTVNIILLTNMKLTPRAMTRAVITATEAKTAALWDLDIRSSYTPLTNPATGTGTDNLIVVEGNGTPIDNAGGHTRMGELIAKAVYAGVRDAVFRQNGVGPNRNVFQRLGDRRVQVGGLLADCECGRKKRELAGRLEELLLEPVYAGFIQAAMALSDQYQRGLVSDISGFQAWCGRVSEEIAGRRVDPKPVFTFSEPLPPVMKMAVEALLTGLANRSAVEE